MKRVLYIGSGAPWSGGAGYLVRQQLFLRALSEVADVTLAMFDCDPTKPEPTGRPITAIPSPTRKSPGRWSTIAQDVFGDTPRMLRGYSLDGPRSAVARLNPSGFDFVFAYRIDFGHFAGVLGQPHLLLDVDDPEHTRWKRRIEATTGGDGDWRTRRDLAALCKFEHDAVANAVLSFVCQENDTHGWAIPPAVVPNVIRRVINPQRTPIPGRVLFVGNCAGGAATPNGDAVRFFLTDIWPSVLKEMPTARFVIAGAVGDYVKSLVASARNATALGFVEDLSLEYASSALAVAPIRFGTGTRIKILEAFAHACPVLSTLSGAEGIEAIPGREIELATDADDFACRCVELLRNDTMRESIGAGGYALAARTYDADVQHERLVEMLRATIDPEKSKAD